MTYVKLEAMKENISTIIVKFFVVTTLALVLTLAAFAIGFSVGSHYPARIAAAPALPTPVQCAPCPLPTGAGAQPIATPPAQVPTAASSATPTATPLAPAKPTTRPTPYAGNAGLIDQELFRDVWDLLEEQFYGDLPQGQEITYAAIRGLVSSLGDPHTMFLEPKEAAISKMDMEGSFEGIGAHVKEAEGGGVLITYLFAGQPAEKAGLQVGDVIVAVDGQDVTGMTLTEAISLIRGPRDTKVTLTIHRGDQPPFDVTLVRARIEIPIVVTKTLADGQIEYVALGEFTSNAPARLADALRTALAKKPTGLVLDLRGNPGGFLDAAVRIASYFVPEGSITVERFKDGTERVYDRDGRYLLGQTPLVVLVDGGSASASEIVAGAIQDAGTGVLIGAKTYGKGSVQQINNLSDGSELRVTAARWFTPKGRGIHQTGLEPDIAVPITSEDVAAKRDPQLDRAVEYLLENR
jgi:carboxyl-terminal processing protease